MKTIEKSIKIALCEKHGCFESREFIAGRWSHCPKCNEAQNRKNIEFRNAELKRERLEKLALKINQSGIPTRFADRSFENFIAVSPEQKNAFRFASEYANTFGEDAFKTGRSVIFVGKPGTGKTHLAIAIAIRVMLLGGNVIFTTVFRALRRVKDTWRNGSGESETEVVDEFSKVPLLILDEIGVQFGSETEKNIIFDILNARYESRLPTILLSNLMPSELIAFVGERVIDRFREDDGKIIPFAWDSYRKVFP